jgi:predicted AlkP superfamily pyrophosphatase or phosphodiesterase
VAWQKLSRTIRDRDFDFAFVVFPSVDEFSHRSSPFHPRVRQAYRDIDGFVGKMVADLEKSGIRDETLIALVSDHGLSETKKHFDIGPWLETQKGYRTLAMAVKNECGELGYP